PLERPLRVRGADPQRRTSKRIAATADCAFTVAIEHQPMSGACFPCGLATDSRMRCALSEYSLHLHGTFQQEARQERATALQPPRQRPRQPQLQAVRANQS